MPPREDHPYRPDTVAGYLVEMARTGNVALLSEPGNEGVELPPWTCTWMKGRDEATAKGAGPYQACARAWDLMHGSADAPEMVSAATGSKSGLHLGVLGHTSTGAGTRTRKRAR